MENTNSKIAGIKIPAKLKNILSTHTSLITFIAMLIFLGVITNGAALRIGSLQNLVVAEAVRAFAALGVGMIIITRGIDLSLGQVIGLSACVASSFSQTADYNSALYAGQEFALWVPVVAGITVGALFGLFNGILVAYGNIPPFIATLGSMSIARGFKLIYTQASTLGSLKNEYKVISQGFLGPIPYLLLYVLVAAFVIWVLMNHTKQGKSIYAIGGNAMAAKVSGINVKAQLVRVYLYAGILYGIAGILLSARLGLANPLTGNDMELDAIAAVTVGGISHAGGVGTVGGMMIGLMTLGLINFGMTFLGVNSYFQLLVKGGIIILAVYMDMRKHSRKE
ncbi:MULTISPECIES: ABC transporter permease [unclassified Oceanispirochaeta]|uniref:ABC transporter permease n=1 Tax=unclassified Oceanispirochaeta TaxID=2635722 RepID=UPI000E09A562|nr:MULTISPECIES: ABC transporter permease [unclassified Oceanispirochaeta]MBF9014558.1 ABC transporter permease [Oceanispirochaeta sp. M2]NPD70814.1 ABC transporter permease [Oceanispirochaeta sp. M1]RDG34096.1 ABC transporter permease [Oceanispirochaeta sp. M1]